MRRSPTGCWARRSPPPPSALRPISSRTRAPALGAHRRRQPRRHRLGPPHRPPVAPEQRAPRRPLPPIAGLIGVAVPALAVFGVAIVVGNSNEPPPIATTPSRRPAHRARGSRPPAPAPRPTAPRRSSAVGDRRSRSSSTAGGLPRSTATAAYTVWLTNGGRRDAHVRRHAAHRRQRPRRRPRPAEGRPAALPRGARHAPAQHRHADPPRARRAARAAAVALFAVVGQQRVHVRPWSRSRPPRNASSMRNAQPTTSPPSCSTSSHERARGPAGGQQVVVDEHARAGRDGVAVQLERVGRRTPARTRPGPSSCGQLAGLAGQDEAGAELARHRRPEQEAARLGADDDVDVQRLGASSASPRPRRRAPPGVASSGVMSLKTIPASGSPGCRGCSSREVDGSRQRRRSCAGRGSAAGA